MSGNVNPNGGGAYMFFHLAVAMRRLSGEAGRATAKPDANTGA